MKRALRILCALLCAICVANGHFLAAAKADVLELEFTYIQEGDADPSWPRFQEYLSVNEKGAVENEALFDEKTLAALLAYQQKYALEETGTFDDATLMLLLGVPADSAGVDFHRLGANAWRKKVPFDARLQRHVRAAPDVRRQCGGAGFHGLQKML